jgi:oligopeptide/dipeptide ABC transporter ATP-binding protein
MYAGRKIEEAPVKEVFANPLHPYTQGLLTSVPRLATQASERTERLNEIPGIVPAITDKLMGCHFAPRCSRASEQCGIETPVLSAHRVGHDVACWHVENDGE